MQERPPKVYITNRGGHNYEKAKVYGELVYVTEGTLSRFNTANLYRAFISAMQDSQSNDFLLITSMNVLNAIGAAVFARKHGRLNLLLFRDNEYIVREVDIDSLLNVQDIIDGAQDYLDNN